MPRPRQETSIYSLAKEFGVSAATVSKALSNNPEISANLRNKLRGRAKELNFLPTKPRRKTLNICALLDFEFEKSFRLSGYSEAVIEGIYSFCRANNVEFSLFAETTDSLEKMSLTKELLLRNADGVIIIGASPERKYFADLALNRFAFCCVFDGPPARTVQVDNLAAGRIALNHLVGLGHRKIAIARQLARRSASGNRFMGFLHAATSAGLPPEAIIELMPSAAEAAYDWGREILRNWLAARRPFSALFCLAENVALGLLSEAAVRGVRIPQDLSVLTCDDLVVCSEAAPPLSVVDIPNNDAGTLAAMRVWSELTGKNRDSRGIKLPTSHPLPVDRVIQRASTAVPAAG